MPLMVMVLIGFMGGLMTMIVINVYKKVLEYWKA